MRREENIMTQKHLITNWIAMAKTFPESIFSISVLTFYFILSYYMFF